MSVSSFILLLPFIILLDIFKCICAVVYVWLYFLTIQHLWLTCLHRMNYPPTKRLRGLNQDIATGTAFDDPFGDDDSFTQDDLDEIDVIASQAFTTATSSGQGSKPVAKPVESSAGSVAQSRSSSRTTTNYNRENKFGFSSSNSRGRPSRDPLGKFRARIHHRVWEAIQTS